MQSASVIPELEPSAEVAQTTVDWRTLDKGSEEFRAYYFKRQREGFYVVMEMALEKVQAAYQHKLRYWCSLDKDRQDAILAQVLDMHTMDPYADLDDEEMVGLDIFMGVYRVIDNVFIRKAMATKSLQKEPGSKHSKARRDGLLRKAIQNQQFQQ